MNLSTDIGIIKTNTGFFCECMVKKRTTLLKDVAFYVAGLKICFLVFLFLKRSVSLSRNSYTDGVGMYYFVAVLYQKVLLIGDR